MGDRSAFGDGRFVVERILGTGGMGVVYRVRDVRLDREVALKTLKNLSGAGLYFFKNEFRALADLRHPNLIRYHELFCEEAPWFFTMEVVAGCDILRWIRRTVPAETTPSASTVGVQHAARTLTISSAAVSTVPVATFRAPPAIEGRGAVIVSSAGAHGYEEGALRDAFAQLVEALAALHAEAKIHRDVKPSNVMVTPEGRVVLMDFGLAAEVGEHGATESVAGTPLYMAPEQMTTHAVGPAADWYGVGVMLFEALAGRIPFDAVSLRGLHRAKLEGAPSPRALHPDVPADLDALCRALLSPDPAARPNGAEILARLGVAVRSGAPAISSAAPSAGKSGPIVGQERELLVLDEALRDARAHGAAAALVCGESGIGKSTLLRRFVAPLPQRERAVVLSGRCYEQEFLPYKAFDGVVDALSRHLFSLDPPTMQRLLPPEAPILARVFPVLKRLPVLEGAAPGPGRDPAELRRIAFTALREIFCRVAAERPLVVFIDDLQWSDQDSLLLFAELLRANAGRYLLVATVRGAYEALVAEQGPLRALRDVRARIRPITLGRLSRDDAFTLVRRLSGAADEVAEALVQEAEGHPLFLRELALHAHHASGERTAVARLDDVLAARTAALPAEARGLLEIVALAGAPIPQRTLARASRLAPAPLAERVDALRDAYLVRTLGRQDTDTIEPYHDRIRESLIARLDAETRRGHHLRLAEALEEEGAADSDPQVLLRHFEAAGEHARAAKHAEHAAERALAALAFDQAAELLRAALRLGRYDAVDRRRLSLALGEALGSAGRGTEAADVYLAIAKRGDPRLRFECESLAADHLCSAGHLDRGMAILRGLMRSIGEELPSRRRALAELFWARGRLELRGLGSDLVDASRVPEAQALRADIYRTISVDVTPIEPLAGGLYTTKHLLLALEMGEPRRLADALATYGIIASLEGPRSLAKTQRLLERAREVWRATDGDTMIDAWIQVVWSARTFWGAGMSPRSADEDVLRAEARLRNHAGVAKRLATTRLLRLTMLYAIGDYRAMCDWGRSLILDAVRRRDHYGEFTFTVLNATAWLADDQPGELRRVLDDLAPWIPMEVDYQSQHFYELRGRSNLALYEGDPGPVLALARRHLPRVPFTIKATPCMIGTIQWTVARLLLAAAKDPYDPLLDEASAYADRMDALGLGFTTAQARLARAAIARRRGAPVTALALLDEAARLAVAAGMEDAAAAARWRAGEILGGEEGRARVAAAAQALAALGAKRPDRMVEVVAPGFGPPRG